MNADGALIQPPTPHIPRETAQEARAQALALRRNQTAYYGAYVDVAALAANELRTGGSRARVESRPEQTSLADAGSVRVRQRERDNSAASESDGESNVALRGTPQDHEQSVNSRSGVDRQRPATHSSAVDGGIAQGARRVEFVAPRAPTHVATGVLASGASIARATTGQSIATPAHGVASVGAARRTPHAPLQKLETLASRGREQLERQQLVEQSLRALRATIRRDGGEVTLKLRPEGMGALDVRVEVRGESVWAWLRPTTPAAHRLLEESVEQLRAGLEQRGLRVEHLGIEPATSRLPEVAESPSQETSERKLAQQGGTTGGGAWNGPLHQHGDSGGAGVGQEREESREHDAGTLGGTLTESDNPAVLGWIA